MTLPIHNQPAPNQFIPDQLVPNQPLPDLQIPQHAAPNLPDAVERPQSQEAQRPDPGLAQAIRQNQPHLGGENAQGAGFAARHQVTAGHNWDLSKSEELLKLTQKSVEEIKSSVDGSAKLDEYANQLKEQVNRALLAHPAKAQELTEQLQDLIKTVHDIKEARHALTDGIKDGSDPDLKPEKALKQIRSSLRVFRYSMERALQKAGVPGFESGTMVKSELFMRGTQNLFSSHKISQEQITEVMRQETLLKLQLKDLNETLRSLDPNLSAPDLPMEARLQESIGGTLELSHRTNDQIRNYNDQKSTESYLRGMLDTLAQKGGSHKVVFTAGVGALLGLGFPAGFATGLKAGARVTLIGEVVSQGPGKPLNVTFRAGGGLEAKLMAETGVGTKILDKLTGRKDAPDLSGEVGGSAQLSRFVTRSYASLDDLIADAGRCKLATARTLGSAIWGGIKSCGLAIGRLGTKFLRWAGRRTGDVLQNNAAYLNSLKTRGVVNKLDELLAKRVNPLIVAERSGYTAEFQGLLAANASLGGGLASIGGQAQATHQREFSVNANTFAPVALVLRDSESRESLMNMLRPGADGQEQAQLPQWQSAEELGKAYDELMERVEQNPPSGKAEWADLANQIRTLMITAEVRCRDNAISREQADQLLERFSQPKIALPSEVFREYLMDGSGSAKPAKIRNSVTLKFQFSLFKSFTGNLTSPLGSLTKTAADSFIKGTADGLVGTARQQLGLDTTVQYRFSSEKPSKPGSDPRPWENTVKTTHELAISASAPVRLILDSTARMVLRNGQRADLEAQPSGGDIVKDSLKSTGKDALKGLPAKIIPKLLVAGVKEGAKAAVLKWLSNPDNVEKLINFALDHAEDALDLLTGTLDWVVEHPEETLEAAFQAYSYIHGAHSLGSTSHMRVVKWDFEDGQLSGFSLNDEKSSTTGLKVDPVGVGLGVGFDISYSVTDTLRESGMLVAPTLTALLGHTENFMLANTGLSHPGSNEPLKNFLAANLDEVRRTLSELNTEKNVELYHNALLCAAGDPDLQEKLQSARQQADALPADAPADTAVNALHDLLTTMTLAYRSAQLNA